MVHARYKDKDGHHSSSMHAGDVDKSRGRCGLFADATLDFKLKKKYLHLPFYSKKQISQAQQWVRRGNTRRQSPKKQFTLHVKLKFMVTLHSQPRNPADLSPQTKVTKGGKRMHRA